MPQVRTVAKRVLAHDASSLLLGDLQAHDVERFLADLHLAPASKKKTLGVVSRAFKWARKFGHWRGANPLKDVEPIQVQESTLGDYLKLEKVAPLLQALPPLFTAAVYTGMRKGEFAALRREGIDFARGAIHGRRSGENETTKGGHHDFIPIHPGLAPVLAAALAESKTEYVFPGITPDTDLPAVLRRGLKKARLAMRGFEHRCRKHHCGHREHAPDDAGRFSPTHPAALMQPIPLVRPLRFQDLRHTAVHLLFNAGLDVPVVH